MRRNRNISGRKGERGIVVVLVAVFLLFVVGAMAALAIDLVTIYTARSEAQLAADGAALAAARVIANSGMTSNPADTNLVLDVTDSTSGLATKFAIQVATSNKVGGTNLSAGEVSVTFPNQASPEFGTNPQVRVQITKTDLPTFFARIWGRTQLGVSASATAEVYNPSGADALGGPTLPVAPICVKPWVLPNIDPSKPSDPANRIFHVTTGAIIASPTLLGWDNVSTAPKLRPACTTCTPPLELVRWRFYPGAQTSFPASTQSLPTCSIPLSTDYEQSIAGCVQTPIACNTTVNLDLSNYGSRNQETADAVNCLSHAINNKGDTVNISPPNQAFQFRVGDDNPIAANPAIKGKDVLVSNSLVTVPVFDNSTWNSASPPSSVTVIGFAQLFLNPDGLPAPSTGLVKTTIVNLAGCGTGAIGQPILGNGASPVAVRLISP